MTTDLKSCNSKPSGVEDTILAAQPSAKIRNDSISSKVPVGFRCSVHSSIFTTSTLAFSSERTIWRASFNALNAAKHPMKPMVRSEEHTSELQSRENLVCRLLLEK